MICDPIKLTRELLAAGVPVWGVDSDGKLTMADGQSLTAEQQATADAVCAAHDPARPTEGELFDRSGGLAGAASAVLAQLLGGPAAPAWALDLVQRAAARCRGE